MMKKFISHNEMLDIPAMEMSDLDKLPQKPVVSVVMMTRNHEGFITQAVESVVAQKCNFPIELLIGEDFSTDNTSKICKTLQQRYSNLIRLIVASKNVGITNNFLRLVCRAKGKYIALLEGDDYWTNPEKLVKQVRLMETHSNYAWCGTKTLNRTFWVKEKEFYNLKDILQRNFLHTSSVMFRSEILEAYPRYPDIIAWDSMLYAYLSEHGECGFLNEFVSYYRHHKGGSWTGANIVKRMQIAQIFTVTMDEYFKGRYKRILYDRELWIYKMDTAIQLGEGFWQRYRQALLIVRLVFSRMMKVLPGQYLLFAIKVLFQPLTFMYLSFRQKLAIRKRVKALSVFFRQGS